MDQLHVSFSSIIREPAYLDLNEIDWLKKPGLSSEDRGVQTPTGSGNDLATTAMDRISV